MNIRKDGLIKQLIEKLFKEKGHSNTAYVSIDKEDNKTFLNNLSMATGTCAIDALSFSDDGWAVCIDVFGNKNTIFVNPAVTKHVFSFEGYINTNLYDLLKEYDENNDTRFIDCEFCYVELIKDGFIRLEGKELLVWTNIKREV